MGLRLVAQGEKTMSADWPCQVEQVNMDGSVKMKVPMKDQAIYNRPTKLHAVWYPTQVPAGTTPSQAVASQFHGVADVPAYNETEIFVDIPMPNVPPPGVNKYLIIGDFPD